MNKLKGILTHQTVSDEDFRKMMTMPAEEINSWSNVKVEIVESTKDLYNKMAKSIVDTIIENNRKNKNTKIILPVGPTPQYKILANIINRESRSLEASPIP